MLRPLALLVVIALVLPAAAAAKEVVGGQACGADGCVELSAQGARQILEGGPEVAPPAGAGAFYELRARVQADDEIVVVRAAFLPGPGLLRTEDGTWMEGDAAALRRSVAGLAPRPARALVAPELAGPAAPPPVADDGGPRALALAGMGLVAALGVVALWRRRAVAPG